MVDRTIKFRALIEYEDLQHKPYRVWEYYFTFSQPVWLESKIIVKDLQFTGLHDKNRKEIYDGDIVKEFTEGNNLEIKWDYHHVAFVAGNRWCEWLRGYGNSGTNVCMNCEVIGNIYENLDLVTSREPKNG